MISLNNSLDFLKTIDEICFNFLHKISSISQSDKDQKKAKLKKLCLSTFFSFLYSQHLLNKRVISPKNLIINEKIIKPLYTLENFQRKISIYSFKFL